MEIVRDPRSQRSCLPPCLPHPVPLSLSEDHCCSSSPFLPFLPTLVSRRQRRGLLFPRQEDQAHPEPLLTSVTKVELEADPFLLQETRVRAGELDQAAGRPFTLSISNQYGEDEVTHTLQTESRGALQSWMEALWQLFFDMSKRRGLD